MGENTIKIREIGIEVTETEERNLQLTMIEGEEGSGRTVLMIEITGTITTAREDIIVMITIAIITIPIPITIATATVTATTTEILPLL